MSNDVLVIYPYRSHGGIWAFDDERAGLKGEPFVGDINKMIDRMCADAKVRHARQGFTAYFSAKRMPGYHMRLIYIEGQVKEGTTYACPQYALEGWLCPALRHYFGQSPREIYVRAEPMEGASVSCWSRFKYAIGL